MEQNITRYDIYVFAYVYVSVCASVGMRQRCYEGKPASACPLSVKINNASPLDKGHINRDPG